MLLIPALCSAAAFGQSPHLALARHPWMAVTGSPRVGFMVMGLAPEPPAPNACATATTGALNWSSAASWTSCGGNVPSSSNSDTVTIGNSTTMTVDTSQSAGNSGSPHISYVFGITVTVPGTGGSNGNVTFGSGTSVQNNGRATYTAAGSGVTGTVMIRKGMYTAASAQPTVTFSSTTGTVATTNWMQGGGTAAINCSASGVLNIAAGATLTVKGFITYTAGAGNTTPYVTMQPGSNLVSDPSGATANTFYTIGSVSATHGNREFDAKCTAAARCTISAPNGYTAQFGGCSAQFCTGYGGFDLEYTTLTNIGDAAMSWSYPDFGDTAVQHYASHVKWITCGKINNTTRVAGTNFQELDSSHEGTVSADGGILWLNDPGATVTGTVSLQRTYYDLIVGEGDEGQGCKAFKGFTWKGNYFENDVSICGSTAPVATTGNWIQSVRTTNYGDSSWVANGTHINDYFYIDSNPGNPHIRTLPTGASTWDGPVFDVTIANGTGVCLLPSSSNPGSASVLSIIRAMHIPTSDGFDACEIDSPQSTIANLTHTLSYITFAGGRDVRQFGHLAMNENGANPTNTVTLDKNILSFAIQGLSNAFNVVYNNSTSVVVLADDAVSLGAADYNFSGPGLVTTGQSSSNNVLNQGNGYNGRWTVAPGTHDQRSVAFNFIDQYRSLAMFDSKYKGTTKTAWNSGTAYIIGDFVSYTGTIYGAQAVLFRAVATSTNVTPGVTASWQTKWEWYGRYSLRQDMSTNAQSGLTYIDGALPGCTPAVPCGPVEARIAWIKKGYQPTNPGLRTASSDGITPGAVQMPKPSTRVMVQ